MSLTAIEDVFSNPDADCQEKIEFVECYLGKIKEFVFTSSQLNFDDYDGTVSDI